MVELIWAPRALEDLEALIEYISRDAPITARRFAQKLLSRVEILITHPHLGSYLPEDDSQTYRELIQGNYRMIYRVENQRVLIVAVHHAARLLHIEELK
jgi:addiction module RelE/StbE family toxin